jgi:hypothetical protein
MHGQKNIKLDCCVYFPYKVCGFQCVQPPKHICTVPFNYPHQCKSHVAVIQMVAILQIISNLVCYVAQATPKIQIIKFLYITLLTRTFLKCLRGFWKMCWPQP